MSQFSSILRLRVLHFELSNQAILDFFREYDVVELYLNTRGGKFTGEAYVEFRNPLTATKACNEKQNKSIASRYVEIFPANESIALQQATHPDCIPASLSGHCIRLRGLPFTSTSSDVLQFLSPAQPIGSYQGIIFTRGNDGRPTGEAFVTFISTEHYQHALSLDKERLGNRYIEVFESSKGEMYHQIYQRGFYVVAEDDTRMHYSFGSNSFSGNNTASSTSNPGGGGVQDTMRAFSSLHIGQPSQYQHQTRGRYYSSSRNQQQQQQYQQQHPSPSYHYQTADDNMVVVQQGPHLGRVSPIHVFAAPPGSPVAAPAATPTTQFNYGSPAVVMTPLLLQPSFIQQQPAQSPSYIGYMPQPTAWYTTAPAPGTSQQHHVYQQYSHHQQQQQQQQQQYHTMGYSSFRGRSSSSSSSSSLGGGHGRRSRRGSSQHRYSSQQQTSERRQTASTSTAAALGDDDRGDHGRDDTDRDNNDDNDDGGGGDTTK